MGNRNKKIICFYLHGKRAGKHPDSRRGVNGVTAGKRIDLARREADDVLPDWIGARHR